MDSSGKNSEGDSRQEGVTAGARPLPLLFPDPRERSDRGGLLLGPLVLR